MKESLTHADLRKKQKNWIKQCAIFFESITKQIYKLVLGFLKVNGQNS